MDLDTDVLWFIYIFIDDFAWNLKSKYLQSYHIGQASH